MPRPLRVLLVLLCVASAGVLASTASAATDVTGSWFHYERDFSTTGTSLGGITGVYDDITLQDTAGAFSGQTTATDPLRGQLTGGSVRYAVQRIRQAGSPTYAVYQGTLTDGGNVITGYTALCTVGAPSHALQQGTFVMSLPAEANPPTASTTPVGQAALDLCDDPLPPGPDFRHPTTTTAQCFLGASATAPATCVATVTDAGSPQETPSGGVTFSLPAGGGTFPNGPTCTLAQPTATAGSPGTCQVVVQPGAAGFPTGTDVPVTVAYGGGADHRPSSADHASAVGGGGTAPVVVPPPPSTIVPVPVAAPGAVTPDTLPQCQDYSLVSSNLSIPLGDYRGQDGAYGAKAQNVLSCSLLASASVALGGKWVTQNVAAALEALTAGSRFAHTFRTYVETAAGWFESAAQIHPWATSQSTAQATAMHDPPRPDWQRLATAAPPRTPRVRVSGSSAVRAAAKAQNRWTAGLAASRGLADALKVTIDRAGGAKRAKRPAWQGKQMRLAVSLSKRLAAQDTALVALAGTLKALAAHAAAARRGSSPAAIGRTRRAVARHGLTKAQSTRLRRLGYGPAERAAVVAAAKRTAVPTSALLSTPAKAFADPQLAAELRTFALYFRLWAVRPEVAAAAALR
ncbi:hypothetical protein AB0L40_25375 [Patulibacter sp. NPDC049589]|uniref:hypothetical protein n=1 Tax=Patulibacter sp. NPDC049589 TaxID=3154731 RepID=UPI003422836C